MHIDHAAVEHREVCQDAGSILEGLSYIMRMEEGALTRETWADIREASILVMRCVARLDRRKPRAALATRPVLTERERDVARRLGAGHAYKDIASALNVGLSGVQAAVKTIYLKLGVHSRAEVTVLFADELAAATSPEPFAAPEAARAAK